MGISPSIGIRTLLGHLFHGLLVWPSFHPKLNGALRVPFRYRLFFSVYSIGDQIRAGKIPREKHYGSFLNEGNDQRLCANYKKGFLVWYFIVCKHGILFFFLLFPVGMPYSAVPTKEPQHG